VKDLAKYLGGILLAVALLLWVLRGADPAAVWGQLKQASFGLMLVCVALNVGHNVFRVWRWRVLLAPFQPGIPFRPMFVAIIVGYMTSWVVPGRLGELVRPMLLSARERVPLGPCIGSIVADRMLDGMSVVVLFVIGTWITPLTGEAAEHETLIRAGSLTMAALVAGVTVLMLLASSAGVRFEGWLDRRHRMIRWVGRTTISISSGVKALRSPRLAIQLAAYSLMAWVTIAFATLAGVRAAGADVSLGEILVIQPLLVLGVAVPTPGGAGSYHGAMKVGLMLFGVSHVTAVSAAFLMHFLIVVPIIVLGTVLLWTDGISWKELVSSAAQIRKLGSTGGTGPNVGRVVEETP
jgi:uncharacterized protein (TIRG00374 family)